MGERRILDLALSRRRFLGTRRGHGRRCGGHHGRAVRLRAPAPVAQSKTATPPRHSAWVWQFSVDGAPEGIAAALARQHMAALVKTHDGLDWMAKYDHTAAAISGPPQVAAIAVDIRTQRRAVPRVGGDQGHRSRRGGADGGRRARGRRAQPRAGPRGLRRVLDGVARGGRAVRPGAACANAERARRHLHRCAALAASTSCQCRSSCRSSTASGRSSTGKHSTPQDNINAFRYSGYPPDSDGISPMFLLDVAQRVLAPFDRWIVPIGQGASGDHDRVAGLRASRVGAEDAGRLGLALRRDAGVDAAVPRRQPARARAAGAAASDEDADAHAGRHLDASCDTPTKTQDRRRSRPRTRRVRPARRRRTPTP